MARLAIREVALAVDGVSVLNGVNLSVADGELCVLVGRSGAGKSMLVRVIAGLERADIGTIEIDGDLVNERQPAERDVAVVFQRDSLLPAISVYENIAFSLRARRVPRAEVGPRVERVAEILGIAGRLGERTGRLSAADRARVAIGRAVVREAQICMIDEPLSRLPAEIREEMRGDILRLHEAFPGTKIYVTRDPVEAMMLAERTVLLHNGRVEQEGMPISLFELPATLFVADFFGSPRMNLLPGKFSRAGTVDSIVLPGDVVVPLPPRRLSRDVVDGQALILGLRPEHMVRAVRASPPDGTLRHDAVIETVRMIGARTYATFKLGGAPIVAELQTHDVSGPGDRVPVDINLKRASVFDARTEKAL